MIYLDHNATTPLDEDVKMAMTEAFSIFGNPSSGHGFGIAARTLIESARQQAANLFGCATSEIIFTSGGTESNNLAIIGTAYKYKKGHIITSVIEHPSVLNPIKWLETRGFEAAFLPVDSDGRVSPDDVKKAVKNNTILITVMHSNNETGALQPIREIGEIAREYNIAFHTDAAQSAGKMPLNFKDLMVDMVSVASHKFYGPKGIGALCLRSGNDLEPIMFGAGHEKGLRPGTENTVCIAGVGKACEIAARDIDARYEHAANLRELLYELLNGGIDIELNGHKTLRLPNTLNISLNDVASASLIPLISGKVAVSAGSACHSGVTKPSAVLKAMGLSDERALSSVRLSVGKDNTVDEIEEAADIIIRSVNRLLNSPGA
ncbi:MAG: cysteine desulfurase [Nitrospirae bacterium]|nr:cysteine desulfurase [Nitrospirota bacterium]